MVKNSKKGNFKLFNVTEKCRVKIKAIFSNFRFVMNKTVKYLEIMIKFYYKFINRFDQIIAD